MTSEAGDRPGLKITETRDGIIIDIHVQPRASRTEICGLHGEELKVRLTSPPVDDAANRLCCEFLAKWAGVAKSKVTIVSGAKSRHKSVAILGVTAAELLARLAASPGGR